MVDFQHIQICIKQKIPTKIGLNKQVLKFDKRNLINTGLLR
jgi:hypothetical protein